MLKPTELFAEIADEITAVAKHPYREEPLTDSELDQISDRVLMLIARLRGKEEVHDTHK